MLNWDKLLLPLRLGKEEDLPETEVPGRTHFQRDYDRLIFSSPFRRLQNKTQVFPLPGSVFVHNRLTHSLEVASVGRSMGSIVVDRLEDSKYSQLFSEIPTIVSTACLAHDLGNPPFGHSGEDAIRHFFLQNSGKFEKELSYAQLLDLTQFEGNANSLRLLTHSFKGRRAGGFGLSYATMAALVKYPWESTQGVAKKKYGFFQADKAVFEQIASATGLLHRGENTTSYCRHPLVYLMEAADDVCYNIMDLEDAHKLGIISTQRVKELLLDFFPESNSKNVRNRIESTLKVVTDSNEQVAYLRAMVINKLVEECSNSFVEFLPHIMAGEPVNPLMKNLPDESKGALSTISTISVREIYNHHSVVEIELAGFKILNTLLDIFTDALQHRDSSYAKKLLSRIPSQYELNNGSLYLDLLSVVDFVSGMTDTYALELFQNLSGISIPGISR